MYLVIIQCPFLNIDTFRDMTALAMALDNSVLILPFQGVYFYFMGVNKGPYIVWYSLTLNYFKCVCLCCKLVYGWCIYLHVLHFYWMYQLRNMVVTLLFVWCWGLTQQKVWDVYAASYSTDTVKMWWNQMWSVRSKWPHPTTHRASLVSALLLTWEVLSQC